MVVPSSPPAKRPSGPSPEACAVASVLPAAKAVGRAVPSARLKDRLPRWIIMPMAPGDGARHALPQARAIRFPAALTPVLAASLGELGDPAVIAALRPAARSGYAALAVDWRRHRLAPSLSRLASMRSP